MHSESTPFVKIPLPQGEYALIDESDLPLVELFHWNLHISSGHKYVRGHLKGCDGTRIYLHRLLLRAFPNERIDHKNRNGLDCRRSNLRQATSSQNGANRAPRNRYKGVTQKGSRWSAEIKCNSVRFYLGRFDNPEEAARAYDKKAIELFGQFAFLNFPDQDDG